MCTYSLQGYFHGIVYTFCVKTKDLKDIQNAQLCEKVALGSKSIISIHVNLWLDLGLQAMIVMFWFSNKVN
jgi:hypothetical protein